MVCSPKYTFVSLDSLIGVYGLPAFSFSTFGSGRIIQPLIVVLWGSFLMSVSHNFFFMPSGSVVSFQFSVSLRTGRIEYIFSNSGLFKKSLSRISSQVL